MFTIISSSILAGIAISLGAIVNLAIGQPIGPFLFATGLLIVITLQLNLFTGKAGLLITNEYNPLDLFGVWLGNYVGCWFMAGAVLFLFPQNLSQKVIDGSIAIMTTRAESPWYTVVALGVMCGILMYAAVQGSAKASESCKPFVIIFPVATFIYCGFAHCVADMFYYSTAQMYSQTIFPLLLVTAGNLIGCNLPGLFLRAGNNTQSSY